MRPGVVTFVGSGWGLRKKEVDAIGHIVESGSKAQLGLGITVPYNYITNVQLQKGPNLCSCRLEL